MSSSNGIKETDRFSWGSIFLAALVLFFIWHVAAIKLDLDSFPNPYVVLQDLPNFLADKDAWWALLMSLSRMGIGYFCALLFAIPLGLAMGRSERFYCFFYPVVSFFYPMPKAALMPILMLWFGLGDFSKILVIALGVSLPVLFHSYIGASRVDKKMIWVSQSMGMGYFSQLFKVVLPAARPEIMIGCRVGVVMALIVMVSSEMIARQEGIGNLLFTSLDMAHYSMVYLVILLLAILGVLLDWVFELLRKRLAY